MANLFHPDIDPSEYHREKTNRYLRVVEEVAKKHGISTSTVEEIIRIQFKTIADAMRQGEFDTVRLPRLGKFRAHPFTVSRYYHNAAHRSQTKKIGKDNELPWRLVHPNLKKK